MKLGTIEFKDNKYDLTTFSYFSGRMGILLTNVKSSRDTINATLDIDSIPINKRQVIIKNHDANLGLLDELLAKNILECQYKPITLGFNKVYICDLKKQ